MRSRSCPPAVSEADPGVRPRSPLPTPSRRDRAGVALKNASKKQAVSITLTTNEHATATLTLTLDKVTARKLKLEPHRRHAQGGADARHVRRSRSSCRAKARKAFKKLKRVKLTLTAVVTDTAGNETTKTLAVTLKK